MIKWSGKRLLYLCVWLCLSYRLALKVCSTFWAIFRLSGYPSLTYRTYSKYYWWVWMFFACILDRFISVYFQLCFPHTENNLARANSEQRTLIDIFSEHFFFELFSSCERSNSLGGTYFNVQDMWNVRKRNTQVERQEDETVFTLHSRFKRLFSVFRSLYFEHW